MIRQERSLSEMYSIQITESRVRPSNFKTRQSFGFVLLAFCLFYHFSKNLQAIKYFTNLLDDNQESELVFYLLLRAAESFYLEYNRYPGISNELLDSDLSILKKILNKFLNDHRINTTIREEYIHEM